MILKNTRVKSTKITRAAKGQPCTLRIPGVCNRDDSTSVFSHLNGGGMAIKHHDLHGCISCSDCHDWLDERIISRADYDHKMCEFLRAMVETQNFLMKQKLIQVNK